MTAPTPEQFLALPSDPEEDVDELDPIAELERRVAALESLAAAEEPADTQQWMAQEISDLQTAVLTKQALIDEVLAICKPSTSKLANRIREVLAPQTASPAPGDVVSSEPAVDDAAGPGAPEQDVQQRAGEVSAPALSVPAHDAPVEEWRAYARYLGHGRTGPAFNELEQMNRSQIRTMLGIEQPAQAISQ